MANIGMADTLILMVLALVVFGPRRLPQIGRQIGKLMYEFRKASNDFKFQMEEELRQSEEADRRKREEEERQKALTGAPAPAELEAPGASAATEPVYPSADAQSAYADENAYPDLAAESGRSQETAEDATAAAAEAARLRIQPPSTGEVVAAEAPNRAAQPAGRTETADEAEQEGRPATPPEPGAPAAAEMRAGEANEAEQSEPATHHG